ncbi:unnamed protein product, partial [Mesorhabditis belari]|uniref:T-cell immunomodulatory protein n=1 Tax=Mesorhabditis belari TaxID=2138241 RepID=A0AAF3FV34_9BILA
MFPKTSIRTLVIFQGIVQCFALGSFPTPFGVDIVPHSGHICALGDVNGDRNTDLLIFRESIDEAKKGTMELAWVTQDEKGSFWNHTSTIPLTKYDKGNPPRCAVGDFDAESSLDLLITEKKGDGSYQIDKLMLWQYENGDFLFREANLCSFATTTFIEEPNFIDINGDGQADIIGVTKDMKLYCKLGTSMLHPAKECLPDLEPFSCDHLFDNWDLNFADKMPFFGAPWMFVDIDGDLSSELIVPSLSKNDKSLVFDVWSRPKIHPGEGKENSRWAMNEFVQIPSLPSTSHHGAPFVADFNGNGRMEIAVPTCSEERCETVTALSLLEIVGDCVDHCVKPAWEQASIDISGMKIVLSEGSKVLFRVGDFNLDGFPDLVATFKEPNAEKTFTKVVVNDECPDCPQNRTRKFQFKKMSLVEPWEAALGRVTLSTFFDLKEDGNLDILVEYHYSNKRRFSFIPSTEKDDTTFLKVQTYTNVCDGKGCRKGSSQNDIGSGITWPGVCMRFEMTDSWTNGKKEGISCQLPSTTHRSLSTPYALFGLGRSPNFVDKIYIGAPRFVDGKGQTGSFPQLVPNSRIIVIPPKGGLGSWTHRLFVTPSQLIIQSLIVLASVCLLLLLVVIILHIRERKEDRLERLAQSHRFHFDAM